MQDWKRQDLRSKTDSRLRCLDHRTGVAIASLRMLWNSGKGVRGDFMTGYDTCASPALGAKIDFSPDEAAPPLFYIQYQPL